MASSFAMAEYKGLTAPLESMLYPLFLLLQKYTPTPTAIVTASTKPTPTKMYIKLEELSPFSVILDCLTGTLGLMIGATVLVTD